MDIVRATSPELIMLDMNLSLTTTGRDGINLLRKIRIFHPDVPVILISAWGTIPRPSGDGARCLRLRHQALGQPARSWPRCAAPSIPRIQPPRPKNRHPRSTKPERRAIVDALRRSGNLSQAAAALGITRQSLYRRMLKYDIK